MTVHLLSEEAIHVVLEDFNHLIKLLKEHPRKGEVESKIRARAREILTHIYSGGLAPTLTFYLAKGEKNTLNTVKEAFKGEKKLDGEPEKLAYAIILYLIFKRLRQLSFISSDPDDPLKCLHELIKMDPFRRMYASSLLTLYLLEFKKLCEAIFKTQ
ncbi:MAG: type III-B CRISPR module-associated protein Cmr5 [Desulfurococcales archaeon]|nr:type III-B CRISPR module-associated protein Cmr5 [Desulfurococcales archaeon]